MKKVGLLHRFILHVNMVSIPVMESCRINAL